jgi:hypothetical protein
MLGEVVKVKGIEERGDRGSERGVNMNVEVSGDDEVRRRGVENVKQGGELSNEQGE